MQNIIRIILLFFCCQGQSFSAETISDKLIASIVDKKLPKVLYRHKDKPWQLGAYSLKISKVGAARFSSTRTHLNLSFPIEAIVDGKIQKNMLGADINIACSSEVVTDGRIQVKPHLNPEGTTADVSIFIPVPDADLDCDGFKVPVRPLLEKLIANKKQEWENKLASDINALFREVGI